MKVSIPHLGNLYIPMRAVFERLDVEYVVPPLSNQRTLSLGVKYSPEGLCIPFKLTLGNVIEAAELGADTVIMPGGTGICRLGYYARSQQKTLSDLGFNVNIIELGVSEQKLMGLLKTIKALANDAPWTKIISAVRFGLKKLYTLDNIERLTQKTRPVEIVKGTANRIYARAIESIDAADGYGRLQSVENEFTAELNAVKKSEIQPLIVGIIGEFYVLLEPFSNYDIESELGKLGVEVRRTIFISEWTKFSFFLNPLGISEKERIHRAASPYLKRDVGGDGWESVGEKVLHTGEYDGLVHLAPFTCTPEIIARNIMPSTRENIPVLTVLCDEQMAKAGLLTRLEAFVDLIKRRKLAPDQRFKAISV